MVELVLPLIDESRCTGCGTCVDLCPTQAVELLDGRPRIVRPDECDYCGSCEDICPQEAIALPYEIVLADPIET